MCVRAMSMKHCTRKDLEKTISQEFGSGARDLLCIVLINTWIRIDKFPVRSHVGLKVQLSREREIVELFRLIDFNISFIHTMSNEVSSCF
jgi:hypothetical protein